jgi:predicted phage-related endonuclease
MRKEHAVDKLDNVTIFWFVETTHDSLVEIFLQKRLQEYLSGGHYQISPEVLVKGLEEAEHFLASYCQAKDEADKYSKSSTNESMMSPSDEAKRLCTELALVKKKLSLLEDEKEFLETRIKCLIGEHAGIQGLATWKCSVAIKLDSDAVKANYPEVYEACLKENRTRRFYLAKEKEGGAA